MALFFRRGKSRLYFVPTIANQNSVTATELAAGRDLGPTLSDISGFQLTNSPIGTPNLADTFTSQIDGEDTTADSTLTLYDDDTATAIRVALAKGANGFIVMGPYGSTSGKRAEVWPVRSTGVNDEWTTGNDPARYVVGFAITGVPKQNAVFA